MHASALLRRYVSADNGLRQLRLFLDAHGWPSASDLQQVCSMQRRRCCARRVTRRGCAGGDFNVGAADESACGLRHVGVRARSSAG